MRWFKHISFAHSDEKISKLIDEFGATGYGIWWLILEKISLQMDETDRCSIQLSLKSWSKFCRIPKKKFKAFADYLQKIELIILEYEKDYLTIKCPNLLKYRDEWTLKRIRSSKKSPEQLQSDSGVTREQLRLEQSTDRADTETDTEHTQTLVHVHDDLKTSYMKKIEGRFSDHQVRNPKTFQMLSDWIKAKVNLDDIENAFESKQNENVTVPWYFREVVIGFAKARQDGKPIPGKFLSSEERAELAEQHCQRMDMLREQRNEHH